MPKVFLSYRREDSRDMTDRLFDRLAGRLGKDNVFKDVDSIPLGRDFRRVLEKAIDACDILCVVIGLRWLHIAGESGRRRLEHEDDFVRIEIERALARDIAVVPLLVNGAAMPRPDELPGSLQPLAFRNASPIRPDPDFHRDVDRLLHSFGIDPAPSDLPGPPASPPPSPVPHDEAVQKIKAHAEFETMTVFQHRLVTSLHLLFSLCEAEVAFPSRRELRKLVQVETLCTYLRGWTACGGEGPAPGIQTTSDYEATFERAGQLAGEDGSSAVTVGHVLQALAALRPRSVTWYWEQRQVNWEQFAQVGQALQRGQLVSPIRAPTKPWA